MSNLKQVVGIDVAKDELVCCFGVLNSDFKTELKSYFVVKNNTTGIQKLFKWAKSNSKDSPVLYVLEATGVYHEKLAYWLHENNQKVSIVLPNKISNYARTLDIKTSTDHTASQAITQFGLERHLNNWNPPSPVFKTLKQLTRERNQLIDERTVLKNQLHAEKSEAFPNNNSIKRIQARIKLLNAQEKDIVQEIESIVQQDDFLMNKLKYVMSIKGLGLITAITILAETNGFELIRNKKQICSYAGLDVVEKQSGISIKKKPKISKKGNKNIRKCLYMPSMTAIRHNENFKAIYARLVSKHGIKMKGLVAIQRKLLELIYVLYKTETYFDKDYESKKIKGSKNEILEPFQSSLS